MRPDTGMWTLRGVGDARLTLDGVFLSGPDLVLSGSFEQVTLHCCTLDPGTWSGNRFARAADGRALRAVNLRIEGTVHTLVVDRCIAERANVRS